jgi:hypothetical protein
MIALPCGIHLALDDGCKVCDENTSEQIITIKRQIRRANWRLSSAANRELCKQSGEVRAVIWRLLCPGNRSGQVLQPRSAALEDLDGKLYINDNEEIEKIWD